MSVFFLFLGFVPYAFAEATKGFVALAPIPGLTGPGVTDVVNSTSLAKFFNNLYKYLIGLAAVLAVIQIIWGGARIAMNQDNVSILMENKGKIYNAILGLVLVLSPVLVFSIINPSILNLSLNLEPLKTTTSSIAGDGSGTPSTTLGCTEAPGPSDGTLYATCTFKKDAETYVSDHCPSSKTDVKGAVISGGPPFHAWCSPIVTVNVIQVKNYNSTLKLTTYTDKGYFDGNNTFANACTGDWFLVRAGGASDSIPEGTKVDCPTDSSATKILEDNKSLYPYCATVPMYCKHK